jgi:hypothetical protein
LSRPRLGWRIGRCAEIAPPFQGGERCGTVDPDGPSGQARQPVVASPRDFQVADEAR